MISVSRTKLPPLKEYTQYLKVIWKSNWLTNNGELLIRLENRIKDYLGVKNVVCVSSGTTALITALKAMGITNKVYVSPNNYIATVSAPVFLGIKPIFVDDGENYGEPAIFTHLYGIPNIHEEHKNAIYDASHAFPIKYKGRSILSYGRVSIASLHAVKIMQSVEGGILVTEDDEIARKARLIRNFGLVDRYVIEGAGVNFKMSEFHAAMGLCSLNTIDRNLKRLNEISERYNKALGYTHKDVTYYPVWYKKEEDLIKALRLFEQNGIYPRRYFYPPLNKVFGGKDCPKTEDLMSRVLALPLYYDLKLSDQKRIIEIAKETL